MLAPLPPSGRSFKSSSQRFLMQNGGGRDGVQLGDARPRTPWSRTLLYECHVRVNDQRHPDVPGHLRGTFCASHRTRSSTPALPQSEAVEVCRFTIPPWRRLEIEPHQKRKYNTICLILRDPLRDRRARSAGTEFKPVQAFHRAVGHGSHSRDSFTPTGRLTRWLRFAFGYRQRSYYRLTSKIRPLVTSRAAATASPCSTRALALVLDSLLLLVDGDSRHAFDFDLASTLARDPYSSTRFPLFALVQQDPSGTRQLIAEPWTWVPSAIAWRLPAVWAEWNGRYATAFVAFARRLRPMRLSCAVRRATSSTVWRGPSPASLRHLQTVPLKDLVSYDRKHNEANGEDNRDGNSDNASRNWGVEGETRSAQVSRLRERMMKNMLATLAFSQGVPMISHGDEIARSQKGNNNAYCQDNELSWLSWYSIRPIPFTPFCQEVFAITLTNPLFRRPASLPAAPFRSRLQRRLLVARWRRLPGSWGIQNPAWMLIPVRLRRRRRARAAQSGQSLLLLLTPQCSHKALSACPQGPLAGGREHGSGDAAHPKRQRDQCCAALTCAALLPPRLMASFIRTPGFQSSDPVLLGDVEKLTSLIEDRCHEPHTVLGAHPAEHGGGSGIVVRAFHPDATGCEVVMGGSSCEALLAGVFSRCLAGHRRPSTTSCVSFCDVKPWSAKILTASSPRSATSTFTFWRAPSRSGSARRAPQDDDACRRRVAPGLQTRSGQHRR